MPKTAMSTEPTTRLVLVRKSKPFLTVELEEVVYELTWGDFVQVQSSGSANPYWHSRSDYEASDYLKSGNHNGENIIKSASIVATIDGGLCGYFSSYEDFVWHIEYYMRGTILEVLDMEE